MIARITLLLLVGLSAIVSGQENRPQKSEKPVRAERDHQAWETFFKALHDVRNRSRGAQEMGYLLFQRAVREEIGLSEERSKSIREAHSAMRAAADKLFDRLQAGELDSQRLTEELEKIVAEADTVFSQTLGEDRVRDRLIGLFVQHRKTSAVTNKLVADKIQLDEATRLTLVAEREVLERELMEKQSSGNSRPEDRWKSWEKIQRKVEEAVAKKLTPDQLERLEKLKGKEFVFEARPFGAGRPPGPPRGDGPNRERKEGDCKDHQKETEPQDFNLATSQF